MPPRQEKPFPTLEEAAGTSFKSQKALGRSPRRHADVSTLSVSRDIFNMKQYANVIAQSQRQGGRLLQLAYAYSHAPVPRKLPYLGDITWSGRLASYVHR